MRGVFGGETSFSGSGAGGSPTAVAVVSDVLSVGAHARPARRRESPPPTAFHDVSGDFVAPHYVRFTVNDKPGILAQVTDAYARYGINIEGVLQLPKFRKDRLPFVTTLEECSGVGARSRAGRSGAERLPRAAAAVAADLRLMA